MGISIKHRLYKHKTNYIWFIVAAIFTISTIAISTHLQKAHAAFGGSFVMTVTPDTTSVQSGDYVRFKIDYSCSVSACNDVIISMSQPASNSYINANGVITNDSQTASNAWSGTSAIWTMKPSIPAGTAGTLYASWQTKSYLVPNGTVITATATATSGAETVGPVSSTGGVTVTSSPHWLITKTPNNLVYYASDTFKYAYTINMPYDVNYSFLGRENLADFTITDHLPPGAVFQSASSGGTYDSATHTVTWTFNKSNWQPVAPNLDYWANYLPGSSGLSVYVMFPQALNTNGSTVTNTVDYAGHSISDSSTLVTGSASVSSTITYTPTTSLWGNKRMDPSSGYLGPNNSITGDMEHFFYTSATNNGNSNLTGMIRDNLPCLDNAVSPYISDSTIPLSSYSCSEPAEHIKTLRIDATSASRVTAFRWKTNLGTTGVYTGTLPISASVYNIAPSSLGVPAGEYIIGYEADIALDAIGANAGNVTVFTIGVPNPLLKVGDRVQNIANINYTDGVNNYTSVPTAYYTIRDKLPAIATAISDAAGPGQAYLPTQNITWNASYIDRAQPSGDNANVTPDWYVTIPQGLSYVPGSIEYTNLTNIGGVQPELIEVIPGTGNLAGSTQLHLRWPTSASINGYASSYTERPISIKFKTMVAPMLTPGNYSATPPAKSSAASSIPNGIVSAAYAVGYTQLGYATGGSFTTPMTDNSDYNTNANTTERMYSALASWSVSAGTVAFGSIGVNGASDAAASYTDTGHTLVGGAGTYKLDLINASNNGTAVNNLVFYQTLPRTGDTYISENSGLVARGSQYDVYLSGPITPPSGVVVQYSTATNPCRDEVYPNVNNTGCDTTWVSSVTDWSQVTAIRYVLAGTYTPGQGETVNVPIVAATNALPGQTAYTSLAYRAALASDGSLLAAAETPRVALVVSPYGITAAKTASLPASTSLVAGEKFTYTITVSHAGDRSIDLSSVTATDDLTNVLAHATLDATSLTATSSTGGTKPVPTVSGNTLTWTGPLVQGETVQIRYTVTITDQTATTFHNGIIVNGAYSDGITTVSACVVGTEVGCTLTHNTVIAAAVNDSASGPLNTAVTLTPLTNDNAGPGTFIVGSIVLVNPPAGSTVSVDGKTMTVPEGVYKVNDATGTVTFTPNQGFSGVATSVHYTATDELSDGATVTRTALLSVTITPATTADIRTTPYNQPVTVDVTTNDGVNTDNIAKIELYDPATNTYVTSLTNTYGTYTVTEKSVIFTPAFGFTGETQPVTYRLTDTSGGTSLSTIVITILNKTTTLAPTGEGMIGLIGIAIISIAISVLGLFRTVNRVRNT